MGIFGPTRSGYLPINGDNIPAPAVPTERNRKRCSRQRATEFSFQHWRILFVMVAFIFILVLLLGRSPFKGKTKPATLRQADPNSNETTGIVVMTRQGSMMGKRLKTRDGRDYLAFLGIPYAKPPVNELRFKPPEPAESWTGALNATRHAPVCMQDDKQARGIARSEDCLYLNVFTPKTIEDLQRFSRRDTRHRRMKNTLPVVVYIHGGGPAGSCTNNGGEYLLDEDVILVNFNYRLGVLGMLNVHTPAARGNQGLKDQVLALKWVHSNIATFGGDPKRVLIFGESSGSSSVTSHLLSPMSKGLFSRAIGQSGTIMDSAVFSPDPVRNAFDLGNKLNCAEGGETELNVDTLMECLMKAEPEQLVVTIPDISVDRSFMASAESSSGEEEAFLTDTALQLFQSGASVNVVPTILGLNNQEGIGSSLGILKIPQLMDEFNTNWVEEAISSLHLLPNPNNSTMEPEQIVNAVHDFYFGAGNNLTDAAAQNITDMFSDRELTHPMYMTALFLQQALQRQSDPAPTSAASNVYLYYLTEQVPSSLWVQSFSKLNISLEDVKGAGHVDELQFLFPDAGYGFPKIGPNSPHYNFSKMLVHLWTSFANKGVPDTAGFGEQWLPISEPRPFSWYELRGNNSRMTDALNARMSFWDSFPVTDLYF